MRPFRATVDSIAFSVLWGCDRVGPTAVLDWVDVGARSCYIATITRVLVHASGKVQVLRKPGAGSLPVRSRTHAVSAVTPLRANL